MKQLRIVVWVLLAGLVSLGCGTVQMNLHTTVETSGDMVQEVKLVAKGLMASLAQQEPLIDAEAARKEGWQVQSEAGADSFEQTWTRRFSAGETLDNLFGPGFVSITEKQPKAAYSVRDLVFLKEYDLRVQLAPSPELSQQIFADTDIGSEQMARAMLQSMFTMSWTITVPGKVVSTNADRLEKNSATWDLSFTALEEGRQLDLKARYINWPLIVGAGTGVLVLVIGTIVGVRFFGQRKREVHQAPGIGE